MSPPDNVVMTVPQIVEQFKVSTGTVRAWVAAGRLVPVRREGAGPAGGRMYFVRGEVGALVYGLCPVCSNGFKRATLRQRFCSTACRQRWARMHAGAAAPPLFISGKV